MHALVGDVHVFVIVDHVADQDDVDIDFAFMPALALTAAELTFDHLAGVVDLERCQLRRAADGSIDKRRLVGESYRLCFVERRQAGIGHHVDADQLSGPTDHVGRVAEIGSERQ